MTDQDEALAGDFGVSFPRTSLPLAAGLSHRHNGRPVTATWELQSEGEAVERTQRHSDLHMGPPPCQPVSIIT